LEADMAEAQRSEAQRERFGDRFLAFVEDIIYWAIAVMLVAGAATLLVSQVNQFRSLTSQPASMVILGLLDGLLLVFILVELLFAVRACLRSHEIVAEPFLIVGILACMKAIVVLSVQAAKLLGKGPEFSRAVVEIAILGGVVLVLSISAFVLRARRTEPDNSERRPFKR
jgi:uncharacterized membrane protein (DUF373 family)